MIEMNGAERVSRSPDAIASRIDDAIVIMNTEQGTYHTLNRVGSAIWDLLETPQTTAAIETRLTETYAVDPERCRREVSDFLRALANTGVIRVASDSATG